MPLGRPLFVSNISWHPYYLSRRPASIDQRWCLQWLSYPRQLSCGRQPMVMLTSPPNKYWTSLISQTLLHRAMLNDKRDYPEPHLFKPERFLKNGQLDSSVRDPTDIAFGFGRRWALYIFSVSLCLIITILVEFAPENISLIRLWLSLLRLFCQLSTWRKKWMRMGGKFYPRWNILNLQYGRLHFRSWLSYLFIY